jgi:hypothetical protein
MLLALLVLAFLLELLKKGFDSNAAVIAALCVNLVWVPLLLLKLLPLGVC